MGDAAVQIGTVLGGRYKLGERLGSGGWGAVYTAVHTGLGRPVAIKVLHDSTALATDAVTRFEREAKAAAALGHPNIAQVSDFQANPGEPPFLVMELLTGQTLGATMRASRTLAPTRMAWIAYQILAGLDVAHRAGIVHRDIKPDNVFLVAMPGVEDFVKLLDFGIAKLAGDAGSHLTTTGTMLGSPAFMAPEQVRSNDIDHRVDLYALGATMYLALSGRMPFEAANVHALLLAITEQRPVPLHVLDPSFDVALSAVVERAMHKDRNGRFASAEEMRGALEPWLGGMAAHASSTAKGGRMVSPASIATGAVFAPAMAPGPPPAMSAMAMSGPPLGTPPPGAGTNTAPPYGFAPGPQYGGAPPPPLATPQYGSTPNNPYGAPPNPQYAATPPVANPHYGASAQSQYMQAPGHASSMMPAPAPARSGGAVIGLLVAVVVLLLVVVGGGVFFYMSSSSATAPAAAQAGAVAAAPAATGAAGAPGVAATNAGVAATGAPGSVAAAPGAAGAAGAAGKPGVKPALGAAGAPGAAGLVGAGAGAGAGAGGVAAGAPAGVAPAGVALVADAGAAPAAKKQFAGSSFRVGGGTFGNFEIEPSRAAINARGGAINACYAATEFDPPDHQFTDWTFQVDPAGNVTSVRRTTEFQPHPKFDACMTNALRSVKFPVTPAGGSPRINFTSRTRDNP